MDFNDGSIFVHEIPTQPHEVASLEVFEMVHEFLLLNGARKTLHNLGSARKFLSFPSCQSKM